MFTSSLLGVSFMNHQTQNVPLKLLQWPKKFYMFVNNKGQKLILLILIQRKLVIHITFFFCFEKYIVFLCAHKNDLLWCVDIRLCTNSLTRIPSNETFLRCPYCNTTVKTEYNQQLCKLCNFSKLGSKVLGVQFLPLT